MCAQEEIPPLGDLEIGLLYIENRKLSMLRILCLQKLQNDLFDAQRDIVNFCVPTVISEIFKDI